MARIVQDLQDFKHHVYHYNHARNRNGHKHMDGYDYNRVVGYMTLFAYLKEADGNNLWDREKALDVAPWLKVQSVILSMAHVMTKNMMGVSGTINCPRGARVETFELGIENFCEVPSGTSPGS